MRDTTDAAAALAALNAELDAPRPLSKSARLALLKRRELSRRRSAAAKLSRRKNR